tara:strand:- start:42322 stop:43002 length:681 start_codon:yes stop_codon:yes gene_type:complete
MKKITSIVLIAMISFASCKETNNTEKVENLVSKEETSIDSTKQRVFEQDTNVYFCKNDVFKLKVSKENGYDDNGQFMGKYHIPYGEVLIDGNLESIEPKNILLRDISTAQNHIILEVRWHGKNYFKSLCNMDTKEKIVSDKIKRILPNFNPKEGRAKKTNVYYFVLHDEDFGGRNPSEKDILIKKIQQSLDSVVGFDNNVNEHFLKTLEALDIRPNTLGDGVIPPR